VNIINRKVKLLATVAILVVLTSSVVVVSAWHFVKPKPEYVVFDLKLRLNARATVTTFTDASNYPTVVTESYMTDGGVVQANVTINGVVYTYPEDFDYNYTAHLDLNYETGNGFIIIQETLTFNNLPGHPTLKGRAEEKATGLILVPEVDISNLEYFGNYQISGTKMFRNVQGDGMGMEGQSTGLVARHFGLIKGWPF
jgi:hypothetical protein